MPSNVPYTQQPAETNDVIILPYGGMYTITSAHAALLKWSLESGAGFLSVTGMFIAATFAGISVAVGRSTADEEVSRVVLQTGLLADPGCDIGPSNDLQTSDKLLHGGVYQVIGTGQDIGQETDELRFRGTKVAHDFNIIVNVRFDDASETGKAFRPANFD